MGGFVVCAILMSLNSSSALSVFFDLKRVVRNQVAMCLKQFPTFFFTAPFFFSNTFSFTLGTVDIAFFFIANAFLFLGGSRKTTYLGYATPLNSTTMHINMSMFFCMMVV